MDKPARKLLAVQPVKRLAILFIAIVGILPIVRGEQSPSPDTGGVSASGAVLSRDAVVPLTVAATLAGYEPRADTTVKLISLARAEENAAEGIVAAIPPAAKAKIDALVRAQPAERITPGIAVAIAKNGQAIYENTAGERDVSSHAPMLITTPQAIGSITKQFTAAGILLLQQEKKLSIDDKISKYVPEYVHGGEITLRQMLNMVSGISDNDPAIYGDHLTEPITREQMFANLNKLPLMWKPGTHMVYTNTNYNLLGLVVERVSGQPYLAFLRDHIFSPLSMSSTSTIDQPPADMASGYHHAYQRWQTDRLRDGMDAPEPAYEVAWRAHVSL